MSPPADGRVQMGPVVAFAFPLERLAKIVAVALPLERLVKIAYLGGNQRDWSYIQQEFQRAK